MQYTIRYAHINTPNFTIAFAGNNETVIYSLLEKNIRYLLISELTTMDTNWLHESGECVLQPFLSLQQISMFVQQ